MLTLCLASLFALLIPLTGQTLTDAEADRIVTEEISYSEAELIVRAEEECKETEKDKREADLMAEEIVESRVVFQGDQRIIFNRVKRERAVIIC